MDIACPEWTWLVRGDGDRGCRWSDMSARARWPRAPPRHRALSTRRWLWAFLLPSPSGLERASTCSAPIFLFSMLQMVVVLRFCRRVTRAQMTAAV